MTLSSPPSSLLDATRTARGDALSALAGRGPLVLVFLRHFGCPLCQEMVADVGARRAAMEASGTTVVFITHDPALAAATPRVITLVDGRIESDRRTVAEVTR